MLQRNGQQTQTAVAFYHANKESNSFFMPPLDQYLLPKPEEIARHSPFAEGLNKVAHLGLNPARVLWLLPRIESAAAFKQNWAAHFKQAAVLSPCIQTADRLSQPRALVPWLSMQSELVGVLRGSSRLTAGMSAEQVWALAQEYLELALRLILIKRKPEGALDAYLESNHFSAEEAQLVVQIASIYESNLRDLIQAPAARMSRQHLDAALWFDDGEALPGIWLQSYLPDLPVHVVGLPQIQGTEPWQALLANRQEMFTCTHAQQAPIQLQVAPDETTQATQAAARILAWLEENPGQEIAVAVLDRLAARRLVALLADCGVLVDDRTGWRFSTSNVAGWFHFLLQEYATQGQLNNLLHPFTGEPVAGFQPWGCGSLHTLANWAQHFDTLLQRQVWMDMLSADAAGSLLVTILRHMQKTAAQIQFSAQEFLAAWVFIAESQRFRPLDIQSPVRMMPLLSTRLRQFRHVLVLGCAQSHFQESPPGLLPPAVALELGFPGPRLSRVQKLSALYELLCHSAQVVLVHSAKNNGAAEMLLPELQWVDVLLRKATFKTLQKKTYEEASGALSALLQAPFASQWWVPAQDLAVPVHYAPLAPLAIASPPALAHEATRLKVTALDDWAACPLRFGLSHCLPWQDNAERLAPSFEQLRGTFVHRVLEKTAQGMNMPGNNQGDLALWQTTLRSQAQAVWAELPLNDQAALYPFLRFFDQIVPRLAGQLIQRLAQGWHFQSAEEKVHGTLTLQPSGKSIDLRGRVDRVDQQNGRLSIADIKFKDPSTLRAALKNPLDLPQLPAYQAMLDQPGAQLVFLGLHSKRVEWVPFPDLPGDYVSAGFKSWGEVLFHNLSQQLDAFFNGRQAWQAKPGQACKYCRARGVCRPEQAEFVDDDEPAEQDL